MRLYISVPVQLHNLAFSIADLEQMSQQSRSQNTFSISETLTLIPQCALASVKLSATR
jgi:hypothetical protein